jgi:nucleotide-binding universal stress UspA family protein
VTRPVSSPASGAVPPPAPFHRVVVGYDGSPSARTALEAATERAAAWSIPLLVVAAVELWDLSGAEVFTDAAHDGLALAGQRARELGAPEVQTRVVYGSAAWALSDACTDGDLLVVGTHGHHPLPQVLLGSTALSLTTHAPVPVLVARPVARWAAGAAVVAGVDGSPGSLQAAAVAGAEALRRGLRLRLVAAVPAAVDVSGHRHEPPDRLLVEAREWLHEAGQVAQQHAPLLTVERRAHVGRAVELLRAESRRTSLVVVGSRGRGVLRSAVLGSVSREVVRSSACPVLVVRGAADRTVVLDRSTATAAAD